MSTLDLLNAIVDKNSTEIFETFEQEMSARILDRLDDRRIEVAQSLFKENLDEAKSEYAKERLKDLAGEGGGKKLVRTSRTTRAGGATPAETKTPLTGSRVTRSPTTSRAGAAALTPLGRSIGAGEDVKAGLAAERKPQKYGAKKPTTTPATKSEPESGGDKQKYVSTADKPIIEQIGGIVDRIQANARNRGEMHELSYTDHNGQRVTRNISGEHAEIIHGFHRLMGSQDNPNLRQHKIKLLKFLESAPSDEALASFAKNIHETGILPKPSLQTNSLEREGNLVNEADLASMFGDMQKQFPNMKVVSPEQKKAEEMKRREERDKRYASGELKPVSVKPTSGSFGDTRGYGQGRYMGD